MTWDNMSTSDNHIDYNNVFVNFGDRNDSNYTEENEDDTPLKVVIKKELKVINIP